MLESNKARDSASWAMELQLLSKNIDKSPHYTQVGTGKRRLTINESVADTIGLDVRQFDTSPTEKGTSFFRTLVEKETKLKNLEICCHHK